MNTITSLHNPLIRDMKALNQRKGRLEQGRFLVEGEKMIREALSCGLAVRDVLALEDHAYFAGRLKARAFVVPEGVLQAVCDTRSPQGICASFDLPEPTPLSAAPDRIVALDGVQDPGNLGTIWRTADAAGFGAILLGGGCADPLSPKVQRAAMGSGFRVPFMTVDDLPDALRSMKAMGWTVMASDLHGMDFYRRPNPGNRYVLVIGNEARGISHGTKLVADMLLKLPMRGGAESLNAAVAAGIMMYGLTEEK
ncbi:MAG: RNA methyltransferase [Clostridia bacterium]|nr:RNA methyltransferase [Clostridia bacterium]